MILATHTHSLWRNLRWVGDSETALWDWDWVGKFYSTPENTNTAAVGIDRVQILKLFSKEIVEKGNNKQNKTLLSRLLTDLFFSRFSVGMGLSFKQWDAWKEKKRIEKQKCFHNLGLLRKECRDAEIIFDFPIASSSLEENSLNESGWFRGGNWHRLTTATFWGVGKTWYNWGGLCKGWIRIVRLRRIARKQGRNMNSMQLYHSGDTLANASSWIPFRHILSLELFSIGLFWCLTNLRSSIEAVEISMNDHSLSSVIWSFWKKFTPAFTCSLELDSWSRGSRREDLGEMSLMLACKGVANGGVTLAQHLIRILILEERKEPSNYKRGK